MKPFGYDFVESCAYSKCFVKLKKDEFELEGKPRKGRPQEFGSDNLHVLLDYENRNWNWLKHSVPIN